MKSFHLGLFFCVIGCASSPTSAAGDDYHDPSNTSSDSQAKDSKEKEKTDPKPTEATPSKEESSGTVSGKSLTVRSSFSTVEKGPDFYNLRIVLGDKADLCTNLKADSLPKNLNILELSLKATVGVNSPPKVNTKYVILSRTDSEAKNDFFFDSTFSAMNEQCKDTLVRETTDADGNPITESDGYAKGGFVTFTKVTDAEVTGTYELTFPKGGSFKGIFAAPACNVPTPPPPEEDDGETEEVMGTELTCK